MGWGRLGRIKHDDEAERAPDIPSPFLCAFGFPPLKTAAKNRRPTTHIVLCNARLHCYLWCAGGNAGWGPERKALCSPTSFHPFWPLCAQERGPAPRTRSRDRFFYPRQYTSPKKHLDVALGPPGLSPFAPDAPLPPACRAAAELDRLLPADAPRVDCGPHGGFAAAAAAAARVERCGDVIAVVHASENVATDAVAAAAALLDADALGDPAALEAALSALAALPAGDWAFAAFDAATRRVAAARDPAGAAELWWGVAPDTGLLVMASTAADAAAAGCGESSTLFPAGGAFVAADAVPSSPGARGFTLVGGGFTPSPGRLLSFVDDAGDDESDSDRPHHAFRAVRAVPRIDAGGHVCGAVYRVASRPQFAVL